MRQYIECREEQVEDPGNSGEFVMGFRRQAPVFEHPDSVVMGPDSFGPGFLIVEVTGTTPPADGKFTFDNGATFVDQDPYVPPPTQDEVDEDEDDTAIGQLLDINLPDWTAPTRNRALKTMLRMMRRLMRQNRRR